MAFPAHAVQLVDAQRLLSLFSQGIAGRVFRLEPLEALPKSFRPEALPLAMSDGLFVYLPEQIGEFEETRANLGLYKVALMHQLGYFEFGTYEFELEGARSRIPELRSREPKSRLARPGELQKLFDCFGEGRLLRKLFCVFEDYRIDCCLLRTYPGLRGDLDRAMTLAHARRGALPEIDGAAPLLEALVRYTLEAHLPTLLEADLTGLLVPMVRSLSRVREPTADVYSSAGGAIQCLELLRAAFGHSGARSPESAAGAATSTSDEAGESDSAPSLEGIEAALAPVEFRGRPEFELAQLRLRIESAEQLLDTLTEAGSAIPLEILLRLAEEVGLQLEVGGQESAGGQGLPADELAGPASDKVVKTVLDELVRRTQTDRAALGRTFGQESRGERSFLIDEWDCERRTYRRGWCRLLEDHLGGANGREFLDGVWQRHRVLFGRVRRQFQYAKPEAYQRVRRVSEGEEIDLDGALEAHIDRRAGLAPSDRVYLRRDRARREVAAAFLVDLSASVSEPVPDPDAEPREEPPDDYLWGFHDPPLQDREPPRCILDIQKEALALMVQALETLGDAYGIFGFSGHGHRNVEFHVAKEFRDPLRLSVWNAIAAMRPRGYTRMGPAIRHTIQKLGRQDESRKVLLLLSDGFPQDTDYGPDRNDLEYGIQDTAQALAEAELAGIQTFCVTVDRAGHDYLRRMCPDQQYLVIDEVESLPAELGKVYRTLTRMV